MRKKCIMTMVVAAFLILLVGGVSLVGQGNGQQVGQINPSDELVNGC